MKLSTGSFLLKLLSFAILLHTSYSLGPTDTADCIAHPDPHMKTFDGISYDYQHGCDVDLVDAPDIKIQLRLKKYQVQSPTFSSIERLAIYFPSSQETLEIDSNGQHFVYPMIPSNPNPNPAITTIGGYPFTKTVTAEASYMIDLLPQGHFIQIVDLPPLQEAGGLGILIRGHGSLFYNAIGMCGKWNAPAAGLYDRAGVDMLPLPFTNSYSAIIDGSLFGDNWQVGQPVNNYMSNTALPFPPGIHASYPNSCVARRRLQKEERELQNTSTCDYCLGLDNLVQRANCEYDFKVTQDCTWLQQLPFYKKEDILWYESETCCFRRVSTDVGYIMKDAGPDDVGSFIKKACEYGTGDSNEGCYQKKKCDSTGEDCVKLVECQGDDCFVEANCFNRCVRREKAEAGYQLISTKESGYFYEKCLHNDSCFEIRTCKGTEQRKCYLRKECSIDSAINGVCYKDVPCSDPCDPTVAPSPSPTRQNISPTSSPTASQTESPTESESCCFRTISAQSGYAFKEAGPDDVDTFIIEKCEYGTGAWSEECYQKKSCKWDTISAPCQKLVECQGDNCFVEADCFSSCVRREEAETGYQLSYAQESGYFYDKCPHNDLCLEIKTCKGTEQKDCYIRNKCSIEFGDKFCYKDVPCSDPCDPTVAPSALPTVHDISSESPTSSPSALPSLSQTESPSDDQGDPWRCNGCEWMQSTGKVIPSGEDTCDISMKVTLKGRDGKCKDNDGACKGIPCKYRYQVKYSISPNCVKRASCVLIVSDAYTSGTTPTSPIVTEIKKRKGIVKQKWRKVKCLCKTNTKLFKIQCETASGISSQSSKVDYTCSECDLMWLPQDEL